MEYIKPKLDKEISIDDFKHHYWLKKELVEFCVENNISSSGLKMELEEKIEEFLRTGTYIPKSGKMKVLVTETEVDYHKGLLSINTPITSKFKRTRHVREFFINEIGIHFHFTVRLNHFFRDNIGKTLGDAIDDWQEEYSLKQQPGYKSEIVPQCKYNQYIRDYLAENDNKSFQDAVAAWNKIKDTKGNHKYRK